MEHKTITTSRLTTAYRVHGTPARASFCSSTATRLPPPSMSRSWSGWRMSFTWSLPTSAASAAATRSPWTPRGACATSPTTSTSWSRPWAGKSSPSWLVPGGGVAMQYAIDHQRAGWRPVVLQAPLSPYGFGGTYDADGKKLEPLGLASGAGCANAQLVAALPVRRPGLHRLRHRHRLCHARPTR